RSIRIIGSSRRQPGSSASAERPSGAVSRLTGFTGTAAANGRTAPSHPRGGISGFAGHTPHIRHSLGPRAGGAGRGPPSGAGHGGHRLPGPYPVPIERLAWPPAVGAVAGRGGRGAGRVGGLAASQ